MALTKISRGLLSTGISDSSDATAITIDSSENVGIGTTSPSSKLHVYGGAILVDNGSSAGTIYFHDTTNYINLSSDALQFANNGAERMRIDSSGNVGIGTTSPSRPLEVSGSGDTLVRITGGSANAKGIEFYKGSGTATQLYNVSDDLRVFTNAAERMRIDSSGNVGIGTTSPADILHLVNAAPILKVEATNDSSGLRVDVLGQSSGQAFRVLKDTSTTLFTVDISGNVTAAGSISDERLKENISLIDNPLDKIKELKGITYKLKESGYIGTGLIAQDLQKVLPEAVYEVNEPEKNDESYLAISYGNTVGLLVESIKEQQTQIEALQSEINTLKGG